MLTIIVLCFIIFVGIVIGVGFAKDNEYKESLTCFVIVVLAIISIVDIFYLVNEPRDKLRTQAVEYGYAKYEVDSKGKIEFAWIVPTLQPKVEPVKPAPAKLEPVVVEKKNEY